MMLAGLIACPALGQERGRMLLGPAVGVGPAIDRSALTIYGSPECGFFSDGTSTTSSLGLSLLLPSFISNRFSLQIGGGAFYASRRLEGQPVDGVPIYDSVAMQRIELERAYYLDARTVGAYIDLLARYEPFDRFSIGLGPTLGWQIATEYTQTDNILGPGDNTFPDGQSSHPMYEGIERFTPNPLILGSTLRLSYALPFAGRALLVPELTVHADLTSLVRDAAWRSYSVGGNITLLFDVTPAPPPAPPPFMATPLEPQRIDSSALPRMPALAARIAMFGVDEENRPLPVTTVHVSELLHQQHAPLVPALFFDEGSSQIPERYTRLSRVQADTFLIADLAGLNVFEIQHQLLDVVGYRLRANPAARITLVGTGSKDEPAELRRGRAVRVGAYLQEVWGIASSRISLSEGQGAMQRSSEVTEDGRGDNRRVEISSNDENLLGPVITERMIRTFDPPLIRLKPWYQAEAGVKGWTLAITQRGNLVARYSSDDAGKADPNMMWRLDYTAIDSALAPLVAELMVEDSAGGRVTARSELPMTLARRLKVVDGRVDQNGERQQIAYSLLAFDYNLAGLGRQAELTIDEVAEVVAEGASISITGYTDRIGEEQHNIDLSRQRAEAAEAALRARLQRKGVRNVHFTVTGGGVETARFANDLPEGRVLSRGVNILVEQEHAGQ